MISTIRFLNNVRVLYRRLMCRQWPASVVLIHCWFPHWHFGPDTSTLDLQHILGGTIKPKDWYRLISCPVLAAGCDVIFLNGNHTPRLSMYCHVEPAEPWETLPPFLTDLSCGSHHAPDSLTARCLLPSLHLVPSNTHRDGRIQEVLWSFYMNTLWMVWTVDVSQHPDVGPRTVMLH